jgi:hypothetical protein
MIKLKLGEIVDAESIFAKLDRLSKDGKLEFKVTYKIAKLIKKVQPELQDFYAEKQKLLEKFGKEIVDKKEDGTEQPTGQYQVENVEDFMTHMKDLLSIDVELSNVFPFKIDDLEKVSDLSVEDTIRLGKFLEDDNKEEEKERKSIKLNIE